MFCCLNRRIKGRDPHTPFGVIGRAARPFQAAVYFSFLVTFLIIAAASAESRFNGGRLELFINGNLVDDPNNPNDNAVQKILVIPTVGSGYAFDPANNGLVGQPGAVFDLAPAELAAEYAACSNFWREASYGQVTLGSDVLSCFYQIPQQFPLQDPNIGFQEAYIQGVPVALFIQLYGSLSGTFAITFVTDPAEGERQVSFTFDANKTYANMTDVINDMKSQLGVAAAFLEISGAEPGSILERLKIAIKKELTFTGSRIDVNKTASNQLTRLVLGFPMPTVEKIAGTSNVAINSDGAILPGLLRDDYPDLSLTFYDNAETTRFFDWVVNCGPQATCPFQNAADVKTLIASGSAFLAGDVLNATSAEGRAELRFIMELSDGLNYVPVRYAVQPNDDQTAGQFGLQQFESQRGTQPFDPVVVDSNSYTITSQALSAFLNAEIKGAACNISGLFGLPLPVKGSADFEQVKNAATDRINAFLAQYSAIHTVLLTTAILFRDNAGFGWLSAAILHGPGDTSFVYQLRTPIALIKLSTDSSTLAHETGHDLGFPDLYDNTVIGPDRTNSQYHPDWVFPSGWDIMVTHDDMTHPGAYLKQNYHQWVEKHGHVDTLKPTPEGATRVYQLSPLELPSSVYDDLMPLTPPATVKAKTILLPIGGISTTPGGPATHFITIENRQKGIIYNQLLPLLGGIYVADNMADYGLNGRFVRPAARNFSHTLTAFKQDKTSYLGSFPPPVQGQLDFTQTFPVYEGIGLAKLSAIPGPPGFEQDSSQIVVVGYQDINNLDLHIEPWDAPRQYVTRSIWFEVNEEKATVPPPTTGFPGSVGNVETPIAIAGYSAEANGGIPLNWIHVAVTNNGTYDAENVVLQVRVNQPGAVGNPVNFAPLGLTAPQNIPHGTTAFFSIGWSPTSNEHACVHAEVFSWNVAGLGQVADKSPADNQAQENVNTLTMTSSSPWSDVPFSVEAFSGYDDTVTIQLEPQGLPLGYSLVLDTDFVTLPPNGSRIINGTLSWDTLLIRTPDTQDPDLTTYWDSCFCSECDRPARCGQRWNLAAFALIGDFRVPMGGITYNTVARPKLDLGYTAELDANGNIVVQGSITPDNNFDPVVIIIRYPSGLVDFIVERTDGFGGFSATFTPLEEGEIGISAQLPGGHVAAPTDEGPTITINTCGVPEDAKPGLNFRYYEGCWDKLPDFGCLTPKISGTSANFSLAQRLRNDNFAMVFDGLVTVCEAGAYTFCTRSDDGSKLYIDGELVVDNDGLHAVEKRCGRIHLEAGPHKIMVSFFEKSGEQKLEVFWKGPSFSLKKIPNNVLFHTPSDTVAAGLNYGYFEGDWNALPDFNSLTPVNSGVVNNFSIAPRSRDDYFGFAFDGFIKIEKAGDYTFYTSSDDGSRLWIDKALVVDNDGLHATCERSGYIHLEMGLHAVRAAFFEKWGNEVFDVLYQGPGIAKQLIPEKVLFRNATIPVSKGVRYRYFEGTWDALPDFNSLAPNASGIADKFSTAPRSRDDYFGLAFDGQIRIATAGDYTFCTESDDGSKLWIDGALVVDNDGLHANQKRCSSLYLEAGLHAIAVTFFEKAGEQVLDVTYEGPGISARPITDDVLTY